MGYAGKHRYFTYASWLLAVISALIALLPFVYIWKIIKEVLDVAPNFSSATGLVHNGIMAMIFAIVSFLVYISALMCSHLAAFRVATNMRVAVTEHIAKLPLGFADSFGSGKLRKIINDSTGATETYLAHQLPDKYAALATPVGLLVLLFVFDWRLGLLSLIPVVLAFLVMSSMTGKHMAEKMKQYNNALENMSNEAVEYVRGIPVVKTFGQSVFSFKKFKSTIDEYQKWVVAYTKDMRVPMMFYTAAINGVFAFLIAGALWFTADGVTNGFLLNLIFYIVITPVISLTLTKATIAENVKLGKPDATDEEVAAALHTAQCDDIIQKLPDGADTVIGTKGVFLSGGERQRIAIARAVLKNAPVIILDEATAFADPDNEAKVQKAFSELSKGKTVIMIAHRLSTVANADCIYVIKDGLIAESGRRDELLEKNGVFAEMWKEYAASVEWKVAKEGESNVAR